MTLRVKLEIVPFGDEANAREIGRLDIFNKGHVIHSVTRQPIQGLCVYGVIIIDGAGTKAIAAGLADDNVFHNRSDGAWKLVREVLTELNIEGPL